MSLERAEEDHRLMDQVYAHGPSASRLGERTFDIIIIGTGAGGGTIAHALSDSGARILIRRARRFRAAGRRELESRSGLEAPALPDDRAMGRRPAGASSARTRTTASAATRSSGAACCTACAARTFRRSSNRGVSPAWPIDYDTLEPYYERAERLYHVRGKHGLDPTEPDARAVSVRARAALRRHGARSSRSCGAWGCIPRRCRSACCVLARATAASSATPAIRLRASSTQRAKRTSCCVRPALRTSERHAVDERLRAPAGHRRGGTRGRRRGRRARRPGRCASKRRSSSSPPARSIRRRCCCAPRTSGTRQGWRIRPGWSGKRYMAHLATMMQGFHPFRKNSTVFQKTVAINDFYLRGPRGRNTRSGRSSRRAGRTA